MRGGVRGDEGRLRERGHIPEALFVEVRKVEWDAEAVGEATKPAKKAPPRPPSRARGRSRCPSALRVKNHSPLPRSLRYSLSSVSLWPSRIGGAVATRPSLSCS